MPAFDGQLNTNEVFASLYNMVISWQVFPAGVADLSGIYSGKKVDGTLHGDTKVYTSTDSLKTYQWDGTDTPGGYNLLTIKRPPAPKIQKIELDIFRQIPVTVDNYLTKRAFLDEGSFASFNGVILSWMQVTKNVYEHTTYTTHMLVAASAGAKTLGTIALAAPADIAGYDLLRWKAQEIYRQIEDYMAELSEPDRSYNDLGFLRTYKLNDFDMCIPIGVLSSVRKHDVPFLFGPDAKVSIREIHWKYFGTLIDTDGTTIAANVAVRAYVEKDYGALHLFPGDLLPNSTDYLADEVYTAKYTARPTISTNIEIIAIHKQDFPIMSAFSVGTSFFNARRLDMNHYLTFGHNEVDEAHIGERALLKLLTTNA